MKIIATADLHYDWRDESRGLVQALAREVCASGADALALAGDTFAFDPSVLAECLALFEEFEGLKMYVAGNHDIWVEGDSSMPVFSTVIGGVCADQGWRYLEDGPAILGQVGFVGTMGWYDYSFRPWEMNVPERFYRHKTGPGYAKAKEHLRHLVAPPHADVTPEHLRIVTQWMDGRYVHLGMSDPEFTDLLAEKLRRHLGEIRGRVESIVAVLHHLPFREALRSKAGPSWQFGQAFMGAEVLGDVLAAEPKVRLAVYGHSHTDGVVKHSHVKGVNCGSTYRRKQYVVVDTDDRSVAYYRPPNV